MTNLDIKIQTTHILPSGHKDWVRCLLHFAEPLNMIVSLSTDNTLRIWKSCDDFALLSIISVHRFSPNDVVKWSENEILICGVESGHGKAFIYQLTTQDPFYKKNKEFKLGPVSNSCWRILKLSKNEFLYTDSTVFVYDIRTSKIRELDRSTISGNGSINFFTRIMLSKEFNKCFYINCHNDSLDRKSSHPIRLINYETSEKVIELDEDEDFGIITMEIIQDNESEIVICSGYYSKIYLYNTSLPHGKMLFRIILFEDTGSIGALRFCGDSTFCIGNNRGFIKILRSKDMLKHENIKIGSPSSLNKLSNENEFLYFSQRIHYSDDDDEGSRISYGSDDNHFIYCIVPFFMKKKRSEGEEEKVFPCFITSSKDRNVIVNVFDEGLELDMDGSKQRRERKQILMDLGERVMFIGEMMFSEDDDDDDFNDEMDCICVKFVLGVKIRVLKSLFV